MIAVAVLLRVLALLLQGLALPFTATGLGALWITRGILWCARACQDRAREWDPRLWSRGQHTDLHPPPGA